MSKNRINLDRKPANVVNQHDVDDEHYVISAQELNRIAILAERLYTENRMDADEMRDCAQAMASIVENACPLGARDSS